MAEVDSGFDEQDQSEVFDEDNTNPTDEPQPREEAEQFEDLPETYDATSALGDEDDDEALIGEEMDDDEIVAAAADDDDDLDDLEAGGRWEDDADPLESAARDPDEVELEFVGDLNDLEGAGSAAQGLEADTLSDEGLRELDYKDEFTTDEDDRNGPRP